MIPTGRRSRSRLRRPAVVSLALAALTLAPAATAAARPASGSAPHSTANGGAARTIHLVAHERHHAFLDQGPHGPGLGDESIFAGVLNDASDTARVGSFGGTLTSLSVDDSVFAAAVDLRLAGGQIVVQGIFDASAARIVHAITGGTGIYRGARGQFSFTEPASGVLDMTLTLLPSDRG